MLKHKGCPKCILLSHDYIANICLLIMNRKYPRKLL